MSKRKRLLSCFIVLMLAGVATAQTVPSWPEVNREAKAGSRWWWMGSAVDDQNLDYNIREYAKTGIGTLEITPIYGVQNNTKNELRYLSEDWMNALKKAQEVGDAAGVDIDMNGGTGWPFGGPWVPLSETAGKLVTKTDVLTSDGTTPLSFNVASPESNAPLNKVMAYQDDQVVDVTEFVSGNTLKWNAPAGQWRIIAVFNGHTMQAVKRAAPGGEGYVLDHYNAEAVAHYLAHFDEAFEKHGARWPHSFFNDSYEVYGADWTPVMFDEFFKYRGYRLEDHLPELLGLKKDDNNQVLADYRQTLSDMLLNNFTRQWTNWAHGHGATTRNQGHGSPGNLIDFYAAVDIPEIEGFGLTDFKIKGLRTDEGFVRQNYSDFSTLKYASSAAHVTGKTFTSSETFTWLTEHFRTSLSQMKPDLDLMFVAGVNHMLFHGTTYTPRTAQWPGWKFYASIDMSPTNSIWRDAPYLMQYIERCQSFLQMGRPDNDVLVYAPFQNAMHKNTGTFANRLLLFDINTLSQKMPEIVTTVTAVEEAGLDCDYISDQLLLQTSADNNMLLTSGGQYYKALIVPTSTNMPTEVKQHLDELEQQGVKIIYGTTPEAIAAIGVRSEAMRTQLGLRCIRRSNDNGHHYFIVNLSPNDIDGFVPLAVDFQSAVFFNPLDGTMTDAELKDGQVHIQLRSGESVIMQTYRNAVSCGTTKKAVAEVAPWTIPGPWTLTFTDDTFDKTDLLASYTVNDLQGWQTLDTPCSYAMGTGVYTTTFTVTPQLMQIADAGFRLNLGDVRESARVYINDVMIGCAWSAPFVLDCPAGLIHEGSNSLRIEVTNLPANRIRQMDVNGTKWRIFGDVNILDIMDGQEARNDISSYASWQLMPSGLCSPVQLVPLQQSELTLRVEQVTFAEEGDYAYPVYRLSIADGTPIVSLTATGYDDYSVKISPDGSALVILDRKSDEYIPFVATDANGNEYRAYIKAYGAYKPVAFYDFTSSEAPLCGWNSTADVVIRGFEQTGNVSRFISKKSGKVVSEMFDGLTFTSEMNNYFYFYPGYGMNLMRASKLSAKANEGTVAMMSYLVGDSEGKSYEAADSLIIFKQYEAATGNIVFDLHPLGEFYIYRRLSLYEPLSESDGIDKLQISNFKHQTIFDLQGRRLITKPKKGIYIEERKKRIVR
ncbi:MAG: glycosyl hydrolase family 2 [Prevotella sp.]|nr:glycosyl hydrolase family 2 [Prevotella sp.]